MSDIPITQIDLDLSRLPGGPSYQAPRGPSPSEQMSRSELKEFAHMMANFIRSGGVPKTQQSELTYKPAGEAGYMFRGPRGMASLASVADYFWPAVTGTSAVARKEHAPVTAPSVTPEQPQYVPDILQNMLFPKREASPPSAHRPYEPRIPQAEEEQYAPNPYGMEVFRRSPERRGQRPAPLPDTDKPASAPGVEAAVRMFDQPTAGPMQSWIQKQMNKWEANDSLAREMKGMPWQKAPEPATASAGGHGGGNQPPSAVGGYYAGAADSFGSAVASTIPGGGTGAFLGRSLLGRMGPWGSALGGVGAAAGALAAWELAPDVQGVLGRAEASRDAWTRAMAMVGEADMQRSNASREETNLGRIQWNVNKAGRPTEQNVDRRNERLQDQLEQSLRRDQQEVREGRLFPNDPEQGLRNAEDNMPVDYDELGYWGIASLIPATLRHRGVNPEMMRRTRGRNQGFNRFQPRDQDESFEGRGFRAQGTVPMRDWGDRGPLRGNPEAINDQLFDEDAGSEERGKLPDPQLPVFAMSGSSYPLMTS